LVFHWTTYEDGFYYGFIGVCSFIVYVVIFPGLQKLKKYISGEEEVVIPPPPVDEIIGLELGNAEFRDLSQQADAATDESTATMGTNNDNAAQKLASVRNDLFFIIFGAIAYCLCYLVVPLFETEVILFIGKAIYSTLPWKISVGF
jgi:hypothetical protein